MNVSKWIISLTHIHDIGYPISDHQSVTKPRTPDFHNR